MRQEAVEPAGQEGKSLTDEAPSENGASVERQQIVYLFDLLGLVSAFAAVLIFFMNAFATLIEQEDFLSIEMLVCLIPLAVAVFMLCFRPLSRIIDALPKVKALAVVAVAFSLLGPLLGFLPSFLVPACFISLMGFVLLFFFWWAELCAIGHELLSSLISVSLIFLSLIVILVELLEISLTASIVMSCVLSLLSVLCIFMKGSLADLKLIGYNNEDPTKNFKGINNYQIGRFNYVYQGVLIGVELGILLLFYMNELNEFAQYYSFILIAPVACSGFVLLVCRFMAPYEFERISKDYLAVMLSLGFIVLPFLSGGVQVAWLSLLFFIVIVQVVIMTTAIIEIPRFEKVSPIWYFSEFSFFFFGVAGASLAFFLIAANFSPSATIQILCFATVVVASAAQVFLGRVSYPQADSFMEQDNLKASNQVISLLMSDDDRKEGRWKLKINKVCEDYKFTRREREVFEVLARGRNVAYIMDEFVISKSTAKSHVSNIYQKLGIHSQQALISLVEATDIEKEADA